MLSPVKKQQHSISSSNLPAENETTGADKREMVVIMFKKTHIENHALHIMSINTFSKL